MIRIFACVLCALISFTAYAQQSTRRVAITIDDLPWASLPDHAPADLPVQHARLMAALKAERIPIIGFVNEGKLVADGINQPARVAMLRDWLDAGFELGNHTWGHVNLHTVGLTAYEADILRGETVLRPMLASHGQTPRWFRHPFLSAGRSIADKDALQAFLSAHGYRIAPVTIDDSDWIWAKAYRKSLDANDVPTQIHLRRDYLPYMMSKVDYYQRQSRALFGREIPQILLIHANEMTAVNFGRLIDGFRARGYTFITLDEALRDPAYAHADTFVRNYGPSWLHRWAFSEGKTNPFFAGEPVTPAWVMKLAGVDSE